MTCGRTQDGEVMMTARDSVATSLPLLAMLRAKGITNVPEEYALFPDTTIICYYILLKGASYALQTNLCENI